MGPCVRFVPSPLALPVSQEQHAHVDDQRPEDKVAASDDVNLARTQAYSYIRTFSVIHGVAPCTIGPFSKINDHSRMSGRLSFRSDSNKTQLL